MASEQGERSTYGGMTQVSAWLTKLGGDAEKHREMVGRICHRLEAASPEEQSRVCAAVEHCVAGLQRAQEGDSRDAAQLLDGLYTYPTAFRAYWAMMQSVFSGLRTRGPLQRTPSTDEARNPFYTELMPDLTPDAGLDYLLQPASLEPAAFPFPPPASEAMPASTGKGGKESPSAAPLGRSAAELFFSPQDILLLDDTLNSSPIDAALEEVPSQGPVRPSSAAPLNDSHSCPCGGRMRTMARVDPPMNAHRLLLGRPRLGRRLGRRSRPRRARPIG